MKKCILFGVIIWLFSVELTAQQEVGFHFARTFFLGDVSGFNKTSVPIIDRMQFRTWHFAGGVYHRLYLNEWVNLKTSLNAGSLSADDRLVEPGDFASESWKRNYRNLHFRTNFYEFTVGMEVNMSGFLPATRTYRFSPYLMSGVGLMHFSPKAQYQGKWIDLQPLGTEGQGIDNAKFPAKYNKIGVVFPIALGFKYNVTQSVSLGMEIAYKFTLTDYIDDVSGKYPSEDDFYRYYLSDEASLIYALSNRSPEIDPSGMNSSYSEAGNQRGNPDNFDRYLLIGLNVSISLDAFNPINCPVW